MKKYIFSFCLLFIASTVYAQDYSNINPSPYKASVAPSFMSAGGEEATEGESAGSADADSALPTLLNIASAAPDPSYDVGEIPVQYALSPTGAVTYTVPIGIYPEPGGFQPDLSLSYSSQAGEGLAGWGWNVGGLSTIARSGKNFYYDGVTEGVSLTGDIFTLDGMRLIKTATNKYVTEQGHVKVDKVNAREFKVWFPNGNIGVYKSQEDNSLYFPIASMTDMNGNRIEYEYYYQNKNYYITKIQYGLSSEGNDYLASVVFTYKTIAAKNTIYIAGEALKNQRILTKIDVLYNGNTTPQKSYELTYQHKKVDYLTQIDCVAEGGRLSPLKMTYGGDPIGMEYFQTASIRLSRYFENSVQDSRGGRNYIRIQRGKFDLNGKNDGMITYIGMSTYHLNRYNTKGNKEFGTDYHADSQIAIYKELTTTGSVAPTMLTMGAGFQTIQPVDINGDGKDEIVKINYDLNSSKNASVITVTKYSTPTSSASSRTFTITNGHVADGSYTSPIQCEFIFGDFVGNGRTQLLAVTSAYSHKSNGGDYRGSKALLIDVNTFTTLYNGSFPDYRYFQAQYENSGKGPDQLFPIDYTGDGKAEICHLDFTGVNIYTYTGSGFKKIARHTGTINSQAFNFSGSGYSDRELLIGDINGDGKMDLMLSPRMAHYTDGYKHLGQEICNSACPYVDSYGRRQDRGDATRTSVSAGGYETWRHNYSGGVCTVDPSVREWTPYASTSTPSKTWTILTSKGHTADLGSSTTSSGFQASSQNIMYHLADGTGPSYTLVDVDNDGISDLVVNHKGKVSLHLNKNGIFNTTAESRATLTIAANARLAQFNFDMAHYWSGSLISVKDATVTALNYNRDETKERGMIWMDNGSGIRYNHLYTNLKTNPSRYSINGSTVSFPYNKMSQYFNAVGITFRYRGNEQINSFDYEYADGVVHRQGLGFLGFSKIRTKDYRTNRMSEQTFDPEKFGVMTGSETETESGTYEYSVNVATNKTRQVNLTKSTTKDKLRGFITTATYEYDSYGNPTKEEVKYGGYVQYNAVNTYLNINNTSRYLLGLVTNKQETNKRLDDWSVTSSEVTYNSAYLPQTVKSYYNGNFVSSLAYTYTGRGKMASETRKSYTSPVEHTTRYGYDRFSRPLTVTDPMGFTTTTTYSTDKGVIESTRDHWGRVTTYECDRWGRKTRTLYPDGTVATSSVLWNDDPAVDALYVSVGNATGKPETKAYYDVMGREIRTAEKRFNGKYLKVDKVYDDRGRMIRSSLPYTSAAPSKWDKYDYDDYDRLTRIEYASGKVETVSYNLASVTTVRDGIPFTKTYDASGVMISAEDPGGIIKYYYRPDGQLSAVVAPGNVKTSFEYDQYGRQTAIDDPSAGRRTYEYDASGNVKKEVDAEGRKTALSYDNFNRIVTKTIDQVSLTPGQPGGGGTVLNPTSTTRYTYDPGTGLLARISDDSRTTRFIYDEMDRIQTAVDSIVDNKWLERTYAYADGNLSSVRLRTQSSGPNPIVVKNYMYTNGHLSETFANNASIWKLLDENDMGQPSSAATGPLTRSYGYDDYGLPATRSIYCGSATVQDFRYWFDHNTGNLMSRSDETRGWEEEFTYDHLNRLASHFGRQRVVIDPGTPPAIIDPIEPGGPSKERPNLLGNKIKYDDEGKGNIVSHGGVGTFLYGTNKPYQLIGAVTGSNLNPPIPMREQHIVYNTLLRPQVIAEGDNGAIFTYDGNGARVKMMVSEGGTHTMTRYYVDKTYEIETGLAGTKEFLYLDGDAYSASSVYIKEGSNWSINYIGRDYLGSITHVMDSNGVVRQEVSYDAWGRLRNPVSQVLYNTDEQPDLLLRRGYTGHEHLPWFGLINMNARLYDPVLGRFLSPDPYVQAPDFTQNFNRYSYALNNPLRYTDPDGEWIQIIIGAVLGALQGGTQAVVNGGSFWDGAWRGGLAGAAGAAVGYGVGSAMTSGGAGFLGGAATGAAGGFVSGATNAWLNGASFTSGLKAGGMAGGIGGLASGLTAGIVAQSDGYDFFYGSKIGGELTSAAPPSGTVYDKDALAKMAKQLQADGKDLWSVKPGEKGLNGYRTSLNADAKSKGYTEKGGLYYNKNGEEVAGFIIPYSNGNSTVFIAPDVAASRTSAPYSNYVTSFAAGSEILSCRYVSTLGHELIHVENWFAGGYRMDPHLYLARSENAAYNFSMHVYRADPGMVSAFQDILNKYGWTTPYEGFRNTSIFSY